jgi:hypothetical protein
MGQACSMALEKSLYKEIVFQQTPATSPLEFAEILVSDEII